MTGYLERGIVEAVTESRNDTLYRVLANGILYLVSSYALEKGTVMPDKGTEVFFDATMSQVLSAEATQPTMK